MKTLMFGAGVINTLYGHALAEAGNDVPYYLSLKRYVDNPPVLHQ